MKRVLLAALSMLVLSPAAQAAPPDTASIRCNFSDGSLDFEFDYDATAPVIAVDRGGMIFDYTVTARVPYGETMIVVGTLPAPSAMTTAFVIGDENRVHFYRDGRQVDEKQCGLVDKQGR